MLSRKENKINLFLKSVFMFPPYSKKNLLMALGKKPKLSFCDFLISYICFPFNIYRLYNLLKKRKKYNQEPLIKSVNKKEKEKEINIFLTDKRTIPLIVSLTSFPQRMADISYVLYSLINQTLKPDKTILWLAKEQFPQKENDLPNDVIGFVEKGLEIQWCEDLRSYKKLIPALKAFPNANIVTADDDIYYPSDWLEKLYLAHLRHPGCIVAHRTHLIKTMNGKMAPYNEWEKSVSLNQEMFSLFATGCGGILYPEGALDKRVFDRRSFEELCPNADDIWFWVMAVLNGTRISTAENNMKELVYVNPERELNSNGETTLYALNKNGGNDRQLKAVMQKYPEIADILKQDDSLKKKI